MASLDLVLSLLPVFVSLFAVVDPLAAAPVYLALTSGYSRKEKARVALKAVAVGLGVLLFFGFGGEMIFRLFGVTIPAFRIAGGLLIFKYAFDMLHGERPGADGRPQEIENLDRESVGITPLGVPLLTGPGAIATIMVFMSTSPTMEHTLGIYVCAILVFLLSFLFLLGAGYMDRLLGATGLMVTIRLMGLILAAVAVQFVATGALEMVDLFLEAREAATAA